MDSPYQRRPASYKQQPHSENIGSSPCDDQRMATCDSPEERTTQTELFKQQEMEDRCLYNKRRNPHRTNARAHGRIQGPEYGYGGDADCSGAEDTDTGYAPHEFTPDGDHSYGNSSNLAREKLGGRRTASAAHENFKNFSSTRHRNSRGDSRLTKASTNLRQYSDDEEDYQMGVDGENSHMEDDDECEEMEDEDDLFVPDDHKLHSMHQSTDDTARQFWRPVRSTNPYLPPRSSEVQKPSNVNLIPPTVPTSSISDAALLKRGLKRSKTSVMSKRTHGPNDPENILIVNLRENEKMSWPDICQLLNERRIKEGKTPSFTPNGCHNRYNRNAPILFAAEGKEFIPISMQRKLQKNPSGPTMWNDETDTALIRAVQEVDSHKWEKVAGMFNQLTGSNITAAEAALRTKVI